MLKQSVTYTNFEDEQVTEVLRFNISKSELLDKLELKDELEEMSKKFEGPERDLDTEEIKQILGVVKNFMELSYGELSADGRRFQKSPELWKAFTETAAYDSYLMSLFENGGEKAIAFMINIIPSDLRAEVEAAVASRGQISNEQITAMVADAAARTEAEKAPVLAPVAPVLEPTGPSVPDEQDVAALLAQMPEEDESPDETKKEPISRRQANFLKEKLSTEQYESHMVDKIIVD